MQRTLMEQVYQASTLDPALERERLTGALEEAGKRVSPLQANALPPVHKKKRRLFSMLLAPAFGHPAASRIVQG
ncbi:hypothetical protein ACNKHW_17790 [Shigella flexneri]